MTDRITVAAVGDLQLGDSPTTVGYGFYSRYAGKRLDELMSEARPALDGADVLFGNLETTLVAPAVGERDRSALQLRGEPRFAADLKRAGFAVLNVANNHAVQHGDATFAATIDTLAAAGIKPCGVRGQGEWASEPAVLTVKGQRLGFLGYCQRPRQYGQAVPPYAEGSRDEICSDVARLRATGATVIVSMHWGEEFVPRPSVSEMELGHAIIDAGAVAIIGHHPHVTRQAERRGTGVIAYSLGNFMGDMTWYAPFRRGAVLRLETEGDRVTSAELRATRLGDDYRPTMAAEAPEEPVREGALIGLDAGGYARAIEETIGRQRVASYWDAFRRIPKTPIPILMQLVTQTIANKIEALSGRSQ